MSTHNKFYGEIRKILCGYTVLPGAMLAVSVFPYLNSEIKGQSAHLYCAFTVHLYSA